MRQDVRQEVGQTGKRKKSHPAKGKPRAKEQPCAHPPQGTPKLASSLSTWNWGGGGLGNFLPDPKGTKTPPLNVRTLEPNDLAKLQTARLIREERVAIKRLALEEADYDKELAARTLKAEEVATGSPESSVPSLRWTDEKPTGEGLYLNAATKIDLIRPFWVAQFPSASDDDSFMVAASGTLSTTPVDAEGLGDLWLGPLPWPNGKAEMPA